MKYAAAYLRVSTDEQAEHGISLDAQKQRLLAYCTAQGWELYDFFIDDGYSGKNLNRPAMERLIEEAQNKKFDYVVVFKLDRLSRRQKDVLYLLEDVFDDCGVGFKSVTEPFDTTTPFGKAALGMMAVFAQLERETIVERIKMAKIEAARQGRYLGGYIAYGYKHDPETKSIVIDEPAAEIVKWMFETFSHGQTSYGSMCKLLLERGVRSQKGLKRWSKKGIKMLLKNPVYLGVLRHHGKENDGRHDAIITQDLFDKVQNVIENIVESMPKYVTDEKNLLTGIIFCGECGRRMRFKSKRALIKKVRQSPSKYTHYITEGEKLYSLRYYYMCYSQTDVAHVIQNHTPCAMPAARVEDVNEYVIEQLSRISVSPALLRDAANKALDKRGYNQKHSLRELNRRQKQLDGLSKKIERWNDAFEKGAIEIDTLVERTRELRVQRTEIQDAITTIERLMADEVKYKIEAESVIGLLKQFDVIWAHADTNEKRTILSRLIDRVIVSADMSVEVVLNL